MILPRTPRFSEGLLSFRFHDQNLVSIYISPPPRAHLLLYFTIRWVHPTFFTQFCPASSHFLTFLNNLLYNTLNLQALHPYTNCSFMQFKSVPECNSGTAPLLGRDRFTPHIKLIIRPSLYQSALHGLARKWTKKINHVARVVVPRNTNRIRWGNLLGNIHLKKRAEYINMDFNETHNVRIT